MLRRALSLLILGAAVLAACGEKNEAKTAPQGSITDVVVVLKGSSEPLPFDPRGSRITIVTQEIARLVGHPIILELDTALSPELKASLEETVLASFETLARELVFLQKDDPEMFAKAREIERVVCKYDAVAKESEGKIEAKGKILSVDSPPDRFPLLERGVFSDAVYFAYIGDLDKRWGDADPTRLSTSERSAYFTYMMMTRPGAGYLWIAARAKKSSGEGKWDDLRVEHVGRIVKLAGVVERGSPLEKKVRHFLLEEAHFLGGFQAEPPAPGYDRTDKEIVHRVVDGYESWLNQNVTSFSDEERLLLDKAVLEHRSSMCGNDCSPDAVFPKFDRFAFAMSIYDQWVKEGAHVELAQGARGELFKSVICPSKRRGEAETEIRYGCSNFFAMTERNDAQRAKLADTIAQRHDARLLELALLNMDHKGAAQALALVESMKDDAFFRQGTSILFHDFQRSDDVRSALEERAPRWWRDTPSRRGFALLVMARKSEGLDRQYLDSQWTRFVAEFGGPINRDVLASYLSEGPRAIEMTPKIWVALAKTGERDDLVAKSLPVLFERDRQARSSRTAPTLTLLRTRLCDEKNERGLATMRTAIERWVKDHPDDAANMSNARADFTLARCAKPPKEADRD